MEKPRDKDLLPFTIKQVIVKLLDIKDEHIQKVIIYHGNQAGTNLQWKILTIGVHSSVSSTPGNPAMFVDEMICKLAQMLIEYNGQEFDDITVEQGSIKIREKRS